MCAHVELSTNRKDCINGVQTDKHTETHSRCTINRTLLPLKMFYFFFYGACGAVIPFIAVFLKSLRLTAAETGVVTGASVIVAAFLRTGIGVAADKLAARKVFLMISCCGFGATFFLLWFVPPRADILLPGEVAPHNTSGPDIAQFWSGKEQTTRFWVCFSSNGSELCRHPAALGSSPCQLVTNGQAPTRPRVSRRAAGRPESSSPFRADDQTSGEFRSSSSSSNLVKKRSDTSSQLSQTYLNSLEHAGSPCFVLRELDSLSTEKSGKTPSRSTGSSRTASVSTRTDPRPAGGGSEPNACLPDCRATFSSPFASDTPWEVSSEFLLQIGTTDSSDVTSYSDVTVAAMPAGSRMSREGKARPGVFRADSAFLVSLMLVTIARALYSSATSLADAVTYTVLGPLSLKWGRQRMWGTVGTALAVVSATNINDHLQGTSFVALFFACLLLSSLATLVGGVFLRVDRSPKQTSLRRDVSRLLGEAAVRVFLLKLVAYGIMCGTAQNFFLWFLVDLGSDQTTLGLCVVVHCMSSVLTLRFSSRIFKHISHDAVIRIVLATYVVRFLLFSFLTQAWSALPVEVLHGVTYSLMWAAASSTASQMALPGTQASCQAIAGAVYWDLGRGLGNLLTGQLMQAMGGRWTFRAYAGACALMLPLFWLLDRTWPISRQHVLPVSTCEKDFIRHPGEDEGDATQQEEVLYDKDLPANSRPSRNSGADEHNNLLPATDSGETLVPGDDNSASEALQGQGPLNAVKPDVPNSVENGGLQLSKSEDPCTGLLQLRPSAEDVRDDEQTIRVSGN